MRGRKPKPTELKRLTGNPGCRRLPKGEPKFAVASGLPIAPTWLDSVGKECWLRVVSILHPVRLATAGDLEALAKYCDVFSQWWKAREWIQKKGQTYDLLDDGGEIRCVQQYPQVSIYRNLLAVLMKYETEFAMTPASRARVSVPDQAQDDPMDDFLKAAMPSMVGAPLQ